MTRIWESDYPKRFFPAETAEYICYRKSVSHICSIEYDLLMIDSINKKNVLTGLQCERNSFDSCKCRSKNR